MLLFLFTTIIINFIVIIVIIGVIIVTILVCRMLWQNCSLIRFVSVFVIVKQMIRRDFLA